MSKKKQPIGKLKLKVGDEVYVIAGGRRLKDEAGNPKPGKILTINKTKGYVTIEGIERKKAVKPSQLNPEGGIIMVGTPIHVSNVMLKEKYEAKSGAKA